MQSITKPPITQSQLAKIATKHFGAVPNAIKELTDGWFNAAFLFVYPATKYVLKVAPPEDVKVLRYEQNLMAAEVGAMVEVKAKTSLPVPAVIAYDRTREEVDSDYFLAECVQGIPLEKVREGLTDEIKDSVDRQIGTLLRSLHTIDGIGFGTYNGPNHLSWGDAFGFLLDNLRRDQVDADIELPSGTFEAACRHLDSLKEVSTPTMIHWDLWDPNVFIDPHSGTVTGLIDFERALWADPLMEGNFKRPSPSLLAGYGDPILESPGAAARRALYDLYLALVMVIETTYRDFDAEHERMSRNMLDQSIAALDSLP